MPSSARDNHYSNSIAPPPVELSSTTAASPCSSSGGDFLHYSNDHSYMHHQPSFRGSTDEVASNNRCNGDSRISRVVEADKPSSYWDRANFEGKGYRAGL